MRVAACTQAGTVEWALPPTARPTPQRGRGTVLYPVQGGRGGYTIGKSKGEGSAASISQRSHGLNLPKSSEPRRCLSPAHTLRAQAQTI
jgi:hypothetical protein